MSENAMSIEELTFLLAISGTIILLLLALVGYFFKQFIQVIKDLQITMQSFREEYIATKENVSNISMKCSQRNELVDDILTDHGKKIEEHSVEIAKLQVRYGKN